MILKKENLDRALEALSTQAKVLVPSSQGKAGRFVPWRPGVAVDLEMVNGVLPPKDALFPQTQKMFRFRSGGQPSIEEIVEWEPQVIFGIRPCDAASIGCLDLVFLTGEYLDNFYARKRDALTMVAVACTEASETCFCDSMGLAPDAAPLADLLLHPTKEGWNVTVQTDKGRAAAETLAGILEEGEGEPLPAALPALRADMEGVPQEMEKLFDHPVWEEIYRPCLACGTCTFLCPTCYCFEVGAQMQGGEGTQERFWDSCMFSEYTRMAGGHNPRPSGKERVRNRYMHKLSWFEERYGRPLCVGCGRCIAHCPVGMDITQVMDLVKEVEPV